MEYMVHYDYQLVHFIFNFFWFSMKENFIFMQISEEENVESSLEIVFLEKIFLQNLCVNFLLIVLGWIVDTEKKYFISIQFRASNISSKVGFLEAAPEDCVPFWLLFCHCSL